MKEFVCFVPGCTNRMDTLGKSFYTFHRLPTNLKLLEQLAAALDLSECTVLDSEHVMCSAHFLPILEHRDLVRRLLEGNIERKPSLLAVTGAPRCAAAGCSMNLYSGVSLFKFPEEGKRFEFWRMVAGTPAKKDCLFLCARHFKQCSFIDSSREELVEGAIPVYPTRPLHPICMNYCPIKKPEVLAISTGLQECSNVLDPFDIYEPASKLKVETRKKWRCAAMGCDVSYESHPNMRKINFPPDNERARIWREIVGRPRSTKSIHSLCTRHFGIHQFYDGETRMQFVKMTNPVYPTGPLNLNTMDYCPPELDITLALEDDDDDDEGDLSSLIITMHNILTDVPFIGTYSDVNQAERCSSVGCPVTSKTHPNVALFNFPLANPERTNVWMKIAGNPSVDPLRLCARHFDVNHRELIPKYPFWDLDPETETYRPVFDPVFPKCCVPGCGTSEDEDGGNNLSFYRFPLDNETYKVWVQCIGWEQLELYEKGDVFRGFRVCSKHFSERWFILNENNEKLLRLEAIPSLFSVGTDLRTNAKGDKPYLEIEVVNVQDNENESICDASIFVESSDDEQTTDFHCFKRKMATDDSSSECKKTKLIQKHNISKTDSSISEPSSNNKTELSFWIESPVVERQSPNMLLKKTVSKLIESSDRRGKSSDVYRTNDGGSCEKCSRIVADKTVQCELPVDRIENAVTLGCSNSSENNIQDKPDSMSSHRSLSDCDSTDYLRNHSSTIIESAARLFSFTTEKTEKLTDLRGKEKNALNELEKLLMDHLGNVISITGVNFLKRCFDLIVSSALKPNQGPVDITSTQEDHRKFAMPLQMLSSKSYDAFTQIIRLPSSATVRELATNDVGYPGFNKYAFQLLSSKLNEVGDAPFIVSLSVAEVPIKRHVDWNGVDLFGYVDLGYGRIKDDFIPEATSALVFHVNSVTDGFKVPVGYCLIGELSPQIRANLIIQYLMQLHSVGVRCNAIVCDGSVMTYHTYKQLGAIHEKTHQKSGFFKHPSNKSDRVYCFVDIDDVMGMLKNYLADHSCFLYKNHKVCWSDIEKVDDFIQCDLNSMVFPITDREKTLNDLKVLQLQLRNDTRPFKHDAAAFFELINEICHESAGQAKASIDFLSRMKCIDKHFSSCNPFSKEIPGIHRTNTMSTLGLIKNHAIYLESLLDPNGNQLLSSERRLPLLYLHLNLVSLQGYIRRTYSEKKRANLVKTQSFTLRDVRRVFTQMSNGRGDSSFTACQFKDAFYSHFCCNKLPKYLPVMCSRGNIDSPATRSADSPLHTGLYVSESYVYEPLTSMHERFEEFLTENAITSWIQNAKCPQCSGIVLKAINEYQIGDVSLISDVHKMFRLAEKVLSLCDEIPRNWGCKLFLRLANSVLNEMVCFRGFKAHDHLFDSVEFGEISHFTILVKDMLRIFLRYRIGFMSKLGQVVLKSDEHTTFSKRAWI